MSCWSATARSIAMNGTFFALARLIEEVICWPSCAMAMMALTFCVSIRSWIWEACFCASESATSKITLSPAADAASWIADFSAWRVAFSRSKLTPIVIVFGAVLASVVLAPLEPQAAASARR